MTDAPDHPTAPAAATTHPTSQPTTHSTTQPITQPITTSTARRPR